MMLNSAWQSASERTLVMVRRHLDRHRKTKEGYQRILKSVGDGERSKLCVAIFKGFEQSIPSFAWRKLWQSQYNIVYPR